MFFLVNTVIKIYISMYSRFSTTFKEINSSIASVSITKFLVLILFLFNMIYLTQTLIVT